MKTLPILALLAAFVAFVLISFSFEIALSVVFATGLAAIVIGDYSRAIRASALRPVRVVAQRTERFGLAA